MVGPCRETRSARPFVARLLSTYLDDIALSRPGGQVDLEQLKHHITSVADLTDSSPDLWKTVRVWSTALATGAIDASSTSLALLTTGNAAPGSIGAMLHDAPDRDEAGALDRMRVVASTSRNAGLKSSFDAFNQLNAGQQAALVGAMRVLDAATDITGLDALIRDRIRFSTQLQFIQAVQERLEGWWFTQVVNQLVDGSTSAIPQLRVQAMVVEIASQYRDDALPITFLDRLPPTVDPENDDRLFVRQLREITDSNERIEYAITDYYRAFEQRAQWVRDDLLVDTDLEAYEKRLCAELHRHRLALEDEHELDRNDSAACKRFGQKLYGWAERANIRIRPSVTEPYISRGSFHILANRDEPELKVWWHPHFLDRLRSLVGS
jgi:hypothetical protein